MKAILKLVSIFFYISVLSSQTPTCITNPPGDPTVGNPIFGNGCLSNIPKILSRPVRASGLFNLNWNTTYFWWQPCDPVDGTFCDPSVFAQCNTAHYCPDKYCDNVNFFAEINATMIFSAFGPWGSLHNLKDGTALWKSMKSIPVDINAAYDLANLRRPVIQAGIYEHIPVTSSGAYPNFPIPQWVVDTFEANDAEFPQYSNFYNSLSGPPNFDRSNIAGNGGSGEVATDRWDVTKIEARMWIYYLAVSYIDAGYTALHIGDINAWGSKDFQLSPPYHYTALLIDLIRSYANDLGKTVLISTENPPSGNLYDPHFQGDPNYPGVKKLIFDFDNAAIRLREVNDIWNYCDNSIDPLPLEAINKYNFTECDNQNLMSFVDICTIDRRRTLTEAISPNGCYFETVPYVGAFDFSCWNRAIGCDDSNPGCDLVFGTPDNPPPPNNGDGHIYNCWSDMAWFADVLKEPCKSDWLKKTICAFNSYSKGHGNIIIPTSNTVDSYNRFYMFYEEPQSVIDALLEAWDESNIVDFTWQKKCEKEIYYDFECNGERVPPEGDNIFKKQFAYYEFKSLYPDCVSEYSWHIQGANGWEPMTFGHVRKFHPPVNGTYKVNLKQNNLELPGQVNIVEKFIELEPACCSLIEIPWWWDESPPNFSVKAYPSPFDSELTIFLKLQKPETINLRLYNSIGQEVSILMNNIYFSSGEHKQLFDVSQLPSGYYFIRAKNMNDAIINTLPIIKG